MVWLGTRGVLPTNLNNMTSLPLLLNDKVTGDSFLSPSKYIEALALLYCWIFTYSYTFFCRANREYVGSYPQFLWSKLMWDNTDENEASLYNKILIRTGTTTENTCQAAEKLSLWIQKGSSDHCLVGKAQWGGLWTDHQDKGWELTTK